MGYMRIGNCNHCGACCCPPVIIENPMIELGEDRCKFYVDEPNDQMYGHCLIHGRGHRPINTIRDRYNNRITDEQIYWFNDNCIDYPTVENIITGGVPIDCSFSIK